MISTMTIGIAPLVSCNQILHNLLGFAGFERGADREIVTTWKSPVIIQSSFSIETSTQYHVDDAKIFWDKLHCEIKGRSKKNARDFAVDPSMSIEDLLKAIDN
ncbi:hypothetical protein F9U38_12055 [Pectobacterium versatile]|uniref:hypothetical protein n=1 Tax=Pectobacterium versatile TaxID=2488639 RepID=UPI001B3A5899|nr:hypothetical protein [Pectobacterium versatile]MBQ4781241.1 hypothetical protein [Pectobacterium versatile]MBQ4785798.1 hypothetical protein [Pectobacterium versatile]